MHRNNDLSLRLKYKTGTDVTRGNIDSPGTKINIDIDRPTIYPITQLNI